MKTVQLIFAIILTLAFIVFIVVSTYYILKHEGPDESHSATRYAQAQNIEKLSA
jgi:hypothetical protein